MNHFIKCIIRLFRTLVKNDLTEESKREKENRLIEWIRANRPSAKPSETPIPKNVPYYGKYLGSLAETVIEAKRKNQKKLYSLQPTTKKQKSPGGALWLVDERRIIVTRFVFESGSLLNGKKSETRWQNSYLVENVTFWLGPKNPSGNFIEDFMPSENGFYVRPKPIEMSAFAMRELPVCIVSHISCPRYDISVISANWSKTSAQRGSRQIVRRSPSHCGKRHENETRCQCHGNCSDGKTNWAFRRGLDRWRLMKTQDNMFRVG